MALEKLAKIPSLVRKAGQSASKAQPFYSNVDQAIANITQGTGTGAQMLAELLKTKGVAKELKDRPAIKKTLEANKDAKVTKADLERLAAENPPPQIDETALGGKQNYSDAEIEREYRRIYGNPYTSDGERIGIEEMRDAVISSTAGVDSSFAPKYAKHTIPGGENYRELLIKLPSNRSQNYYSTHFNEPNILAHARVTDRVGPNGEKILHVEEIQSDWHQTARDVRKKKIKFLMQEKGIDEATARTMVPEGYGYKKEGIELQIEKSNKKLAELEARHRDLYRQLVNLPNSEKEKFAKLEAERNEIGEQIKGVKDEKNLLDDWRVNSVPDAPLKQNWHELVMKRLLDDAARNGYDRVVITPGAEQAKRYDLSKQISRVVYSPTTETLNAFDNSGKSVLMKSGITPERVEDYIGKEPAKRLLDPQNTKSYLRGGKEDSYHEITGEDLRVGGEGMKGFYDQILPSYLNDYGKRYGVQVGTYEMPVGEKMIPDRAGLGMIRSGEQEMAPFHSFDITPQMREDITTKGVPLYQAAPPVAIGAGAMQEEQPSEYAGGGIIKKAGQIIGKAAQSSGMARPVTATKDLTTLQDFHTSLGDRIRERVAERQNLIESMPFKYDKGQRVFTEDSARKNRLPYEILDRTLYGNMPMRADHPVLGPGKGAVIRDPETGKAMRTPYEAGYRVRSEDPEGWQEYVLPETAIKGDVEMAGGGAVRKALKAVLPKGQQAVLSAEESAENLQKFLGNSRVRDTLYHATPKSFSAFKPGGDDPTLSGPAIWLTPNAKSQPAAHNIGGGERGFKEGTNVMPVYAQARSPLLLDDRLAIEWARDVFAGGSREFPDLIHPKTVEELKKSGYDSIIHADPYGNRGGEQEIIMFEPNKIKSAIGNRGTYDITDPDINKAKGGRVTNDAMWMAVQNKQLRKKHGN